MQTTAKRGEKAKSKPGAWDKPERQAHATKKGPGRKCAKHHSAAAPRVDVAPPLLKRLACNVGRRQAVRATHMAVGRLIGWHSAVFGRRVWRDGEPVHIVKPVRAARVAAIKAVA